MIVNVTYLVREYDEAIQYFVDKLDFELVEDTLITAEKRWVRVRPKSQTGAPAPCLLLARAVGNQQIECIGKQAGDRVFLFLGSPDFKNDYARFKNAGVDFTETPRHEPYGSVVVFRDLYGNLWDLLESPTGQKPDR